MFVDDLVRFQAKLLARGFAGQKVTVRLKERDAGLERPQAGRETRGRPGRGPARRPALAGRDRPPPQADGRASSTPRGRAPPRELQTENNRIERTVNVRKEKLKVLLVDSEPRYEFRYLKNYLEREETIDLSVVLLSSDPEYSEQDRSALPTFPAAKEELFAYDVVLIGDADPSFLSPSQMQNLVEFVTEKGGGLLFIAGENFQPARLPRDARWRSCCRSSWPRPATRRPSAAAIAAFRPELTARRAVAARSSGSATTRPTSARSGRTCPSSTGTSRPRARSRRRWCWPSTPRSAGSDGKLPIVLYQFVGAGKTMFNAVDDTWRWRFRVGDRYFGRYWIQTIRFLARSKLLGQKQAEVPTDRRRYQRNQPVQVRVRFPNPGLAPPAARSSSRSSARGRARAS